MKKILTLGFGIATALLSSYGALAQSQTTALALSSQPEARGSSRYQALSGAMGAVGVDFSSVQQNPAGISLFRSGYKISATLRGASFSGENSFAGQSTDLQSKQALHFDELSYIASTTLGNGKNLTFGIGIHNNGRLFRQLNAFTGNTSGLNGASLADYAAAFTTYAHKNGQPGALNFVANPNRAWDNPWISTLAYTTDWIDASQQNDAQGNKYYLYESKMGTPTSSSLITEERGGISNLDLAVGLELSSRFSMGALLTFTTMNYEYTSFYKEEFAARNAHGDRTGLSLDNKMDISGFGARFGLGLLYQPIDGLRLGASVYTPSLMSYEMTYSARATGNRLAESPGTSKDLSTPVSETNFAFSSPWRFGLNMAYVYGRKGLISFDYEYQNFGGARLRQTSEDDYNYDTSNIYEMENDAIKSDFNGQHTLRFGLEWNATKRLVLRAGMRYTTALSTVNKLAEENPARELLIPVALAHYRLPGAVQGYSLGLGYRISPKWTLDIAYNHRVQKDRVMTAPFVRNDFTQIAYQPVAPIKDTQRENTLSATISCRF